MRGLFIKNFSWYYQRMKITKFGHSCLLVEEGEVRILIDPGDYTDIPRELLNIDVVLITHEHKDHFSVDALKNVLENNPAVVTLTHKSVARILDNENISCEIISDGGEYAIKNTTIKSFGVEHACIHSDLPKIQNTGFLIAGRFFHPGDSFFAPPEKVEILALPVAGPWMKISEAVDYAKLVMPSIVVPIHDGMLRQDRMAPTRLIPEKLLGGVGVQFIDMGEGDMCEF